MSYRQLRPLRPRVVSSLSWATRRGNIVEKIFEMVHGVTLVGLGAADCSATTGGGVRGSRRRPLSSAELSRLPLSSAGIRNLDHRGSCVEAQEESGSHGSNLGALDRLSHRWMTLDGRRARLLLSAKRPSNCAASKKSAITCTMDVRDLLREIFYIL